MKLERLKGENNCVDNIFKNKKQNDIKEETNVEITLMMQYEESLFKRILNKILYLHEKQL